MLRIILLTISIILLPGCPQRDEVPVTHLYVIDYVHNVCSVRVIQDKKTLTSSWVKDVPLSECDGNVSLTMDEFLRLRNWLKHL
jgi:hypothetical protein